MGPMGCTETSVRNYHSTPRNTLEERSFNRSFFSTELPSEWERKLYMALWWILLKQNRTICHTQRIERVRYWYIDTFLTFILTSTAVTPTRVKTGAIVIHNRTYCRYFQFCGTLSTWITKGVQYMNSFALFRARSQNCEKRLLASSSVCLSARNNSAPTERMLMKFDIWVFFENLSRKFKFH
jgi:hypothetical protein